MSLNDNPHLLSCNVLMLLFIILDYNLIAEIEYEGQKIVVTPEYSCVGRCGYHTPEIKPSDCRCDPDCEFFHDCCIDYFDACPARKDSGLFNTTMFTCVTLKDNPYTEIMSVLLVGKCAPDWKEDIIRTHCEMYSHDEFTFSLDKWPVFDQFGNNFKNIFCAICNGYEFKTTQPWNVSFSAVFQGKQSSDEPHSSKCETTDRNQLGTVGRRLRACYPSMISECPPSYKNTSVSSTCAAYSASICYTKFRLFKNPHCAACNGFKETSSSTPCSRFEKSFFAFLKTIWTFAATENENKMLQHDKPCLEENHIFDPYLQQCHNVFCQYGFNFHNESDCTFPLKVTDDISNICCEKQESWLLFKTDDPYGNYFQEDIPCFLKILEPSKSNFLNDWKINFFMGEYFGQIMIVSNNSVCNIASDLDEVFSNHTLDLTSCRSRINSIEYIYMCRNFLERDTCDGIWFNGAAGDFERIHGSVLGDVVVHLGKFIIPQQILHGVSYIRDEKELEFRKIEMVHVCGEINQLLTCPVVTIIRSDNDTIRIRDNDTKLFIFNARVNESEFVIFSDGRILICAESFPKRVAKLFTYSGYLDLVNMVGAILSILSLATLFLLLIRYSNVIGNFHISCIMRLTITLLFAQLLPMIGSKIQVPNRLCVSFAILAHYAWLASFTWMTIIGINLFHSFIYSPLQKQEDRESTKLFCIILPILGWCVPLINVSICIYLHFAKVSFEYGSSAPCWITSQKANLFGFGVPVAIYLGINLSLYLMLVFRFCKNRQRSRQLQEKDPYSVELKDFVLFLKVNIIITTSYSFYLFITYSLMHYTLTNSPMHGLGPSIYILSCPNRSVTHGYPIGQHNADDIQFKKYY